jgi:uncharacterized protein YndB with AHSA1/START domain
MTTTTQPVSLNVSRLIKAPRERVFAALTTPAAVTKWLGCGPCKAAIAKMDLRVGGEFRFRMKADDGDFHIFGVYREINPPSRLVFSWNYDDCGPAGDGSETQVTIDLSEKDAGTLVEISHEGFLTTEVRDKHEHGWNQCLESIEAVA